MKYDGVWLKELKFIGLAYDGLEDTLRANTHSGKTKKIVWSERFEDFFEGVKLPYSSNKVRSLDYRNGYQYLSLMMSEVWKREETDLNGSANLVPDNEMETVEQSNLNKGSASQGVPGSLRDEVWKISDKVNVSSYAFWLLSKRINSLKCEKKV